LSVDEKQNAAAQIAKQLCKSDGWY